MAARDPHVVLAEILELTELESSLIVTRDADAMLMLCRERGALLAELPDALPATCRVLAERLEVHRAANEAAATTAAAAIRTELGGVSTNRTVSAAYGSGTAVAAFDRAG
jgi:hypothetical protein